MKELVVYSFSGEANREAVWREAMRYRKLWYVIANCAFLLCWIFLSVLTARRWHRLAADSHFWAIALIGMFLLLWFYMLREKNSTLTIAAGVIALLASTKLAFP